MSFPPPAAPSSPESLIPASRGVAVVVNGNAKNVTQEVISNLDQILRGTDLFVSHSIEQGREIAESVVSKGYGTVLTGGGDGTFTVMVTEIVRAAQRMQRPLPRFGFLKLGTGNALAYVVGASGQRTLEADIRRLREEAGSRKIGLVDVEGLLAPFCGLGADAAVLLDYAHIKEKLGSGPLKPLSTGLWGYAVSALTRTIPHVFTHSMPHCRVINHGAEAFRLGAQGRVLGNPVPAGELLYEGPARLVGISTIPYYGFGLRMFPYADDRSDRMSLRVVTLGAGEFVRHARAIWKGEYENPDRVFDYLVSDVEVQMDPPTAFQIGGDLKGERSSVRAKLSERPIRLVDFYAPPRGVEG